MRKRMAGSLLAGGLVLLIASCDGKKQAIEPFDEFYNNLVTYSQVYNDLKTNTTPDNITKEADLRQRIVEQREMFPGMEKCTMERCSNSDVEETIRAYEEKGKVYAFVPSLYDKSLRSIILGNIVEIRDEVFNDHGENFPYKIILFEQEGQSIEDAMGKPGRLSYWYHDRAYLNLTKAKEWAKYMFETAEEWNKEGINPPDFSEKIMFETYQLLVEKIKKEHPLMARIKAYKFFEQAFIDLLIESNLEHHEPMHEWYPKTELEAYLNQIAHTKINSYVFWITTVNGVDRELFGFFVKKGYSEDKLLEMNSEERAKVSDNFLK